MWASRNWTEPKAGAHPSLSPAVRAWSCQFLGNSALNEYFSKKQKCLCYDTRKWTRSFHFSWNGSHSWCWPQPVRSLQKKMYIRIEFNRCVVTKTLFFFSPFRCIQMFNFNWSAITAILSVFFFGCFLRANLQFTANKKATKIEFNLHIASRMVSNLTPGRFTAAAEREMYLNKVLELREPPREPRPQLTLSIHGISHDSKYNLIGSTKMSQRKEENMKKWKEKMSTSTSTRLHKHLILHIVRSPNWSLHLVRYIIPIHLQSTCVGCECVCIINWPSLLFRLLLREPETSNSSIHKLNAVPELEFK